MSEPPLRTSVAADLGSAAGVMRELAENRVPLLPAGTLVADQFEIEAPLGRGGMGAVYQARDRSLGRRVAIKLGLHGTDIARIQREATALARLAHPNVVVIFEIGSHDGAPFVAMELCSAGTTRRWLETPRTWRAIVEHFVAAGRGLAAAHAAGIVHGDLKPDNILLGEDGRPRLADFGLARDDADASDRSRGGDGTPRYMAPELAAGAATAASDQFAFAVALYEALAGADPFPRDPAARTAAIERGELAVVAAVPRRIVAALARAMHADPGARWPDVTTLLAALEPPRRRWRAPLLAAGTLAVVGVIVIASRPAHTEPSDDLQSVQPSKCEGLPVDLDRDWTVAQGAQTRAHHPRGRGAAQLLTEVLDRMASDWTIARRRLCKELPTLPSWSPAIGEAGRTCLLAIREDVRHLAALRDQAPADLVANVLGVTFPSSCADPLRLEVAPTDPTVARVSAEHAAIAQLRDQGLAVRALERARALVASLPEGAPPLAVGKANALLGELLLAQVGLGESAASTRTAFFAYRVAGSPQAFEPALRLVEAYSQTGELALADEWLAHARAEATRIELSASNRGALELIAARLRSQHGDHAGAADSIARALAQLDDSGDPRRGLIGLAIRSSLSIFLAELGRAEESVAVARAVVEAREHLYGPDHPILINDLFNVGLGELDLGRIELARAALTRARTIADASLPAGAVLRGYALWNEALAVGRADRRAARALFDRALAIIVEETGAESADAVQLRGDRARWSEPG